MPIIEIGQIVGGVGYTYSEPLEIGSVVSGTYQNKQVTVEVTPLEDIKVATGKDQRWGLSQPLNGIDRFVPVRVLTHINAHDFEELLILSGLGCSASRVGNILEKKFAQAFWDAHCPLPRYSLGQKVIGFAIAAIRG